MTVKRLTGILCLLLLAGLVQTPWLAADDERPGEGDLNRVRKKVEALRAWQLSEELNLDEKTSSRLFPAMRQSDEERWRIESRNRELVRELSRSLERSKQDPRKIDRILDELQSNRRELILAEERHFERVRQILSPADTARYLLFQIKFQRDIRSKAATLLRDRRLRDDDVDGRNGFDDRGRDGPGSGGGDRGGSGGGGGNGGSGGGSGGRR